MADSPLTLAFVIACAYACGCAARPGASASDAAAVQAQERAECPTVGPESSAFLVHGGRVKDGTTMLDPADVLVAGDVVVLVGTAVCYHAERGAQVGFVDAAGATVVAQDGGRVVVGRRRDDLRLVSDGMTRPVVPPQK